MVTAYSYIRFSSEKQRTGDSLRRQIEARDAYILANGLVLDTTLKMQDEGISAWKGDNWNAEKSDFGRFLQMVRSGEIATPCVLIVENLDRLSRQPPEEVVGLMLELLKAGITIHSLIDNKTYKPGETGPNFVINLMVMAMTAQRANEESETKSHRVLENWKRKRKDAREGKPMGPSVVGWCCGGHKLEDGGRAPIELDPVRGEVVQRIFEMYIAGMGYETIAATLHREGVPTFKRSKKKKSAWSHTYVREILSDPATWNGTVRMVDGTEIEGYYPSVISRETFEEAAAVRVGRQKPGFKGRRAKVPNPFAGLLLCKFCGRKLGYKNKGRHRTDDPDHRFVCCVNLDCESHGPRWMFTPFKDAVLERVREALMEVIPSPVEEEDPWANFQSLERELILLRERKMRMAQLAAASGDDVDLVEMVAGLAKQQRELESRISTEREAVTKALAQDEAWKASTETFNAGTDMTPELLRQCLLGILRSITVDVGGKTFSVEYIKPRYPARKEWYEDLEEETV